MATTWALPKRKMRFAIFAFLLCSASAATIADLRRAFEHPPDDARIMMRWWWFGPSQNKAELEREMREMKAAGIGGFEVQPVYPLIAREQLLRICRANFWMRFDLRRQKAKELGLRMDVTLGSGWPFGGPHVPITQAAGRLRVDSTLAAAGGWRHADRKPQRSLSSRPAARARW